MRRLLLVPIIHNYADLGSLADSVRERCERSFGPAAWSRHAQAVERLWKAIRGRLAELRLDYRTLRIYQDGLPLCGFELQIAKELADAGSLNHQLVTALVEQGAVLMGSEDPQLLIREYQMHRHAAQDSSVGNEMPSPEEADRLLEARDRFIAQRIAETLRPGETGLLFLGARHRLEELIAADIQVESVL